MKVAPFPIPQRSKEALNQSAEMLGPMHRSTLKFMDESIEEAYQKYLREKSLAEGGHNPSVKSRYVFFSAVYFSTLLLTLLCHVVEGFLDPSYKTMIATQVVVVVGLMSIGLIVVTLTYFYSDRRKSASTAFVTLYLVTVVGLTITDRSILLEYIEETEVGQHLSAIFPILLITFAMESIIYYDFIVYFLCGVAIALTFLAISLTGGRTAQLTVFDFLFFMLFLISNSRRLFLTERMSRKMFYMEMAERDMRLFHQSSAAKSPPPQTPVGDGYNIEVENIMNLINSSIGIIGEASKIVIYEDLRAKLRQALANLSIAGVKLKAGPQIFEAKVETMNPNIDEEDRIFVEENCLAQKSEFSQDFMRQRVVERRPVDLRLACDFDEVMAVLNQMGKNWNFDTFFLQECTSGKALSIAGRYFLSTFNLQEKFAIPENVAIAYLEHLEANYKPNPYHNSCHAADVLNSCLFITKSSVLLSYVSDVEILSLIIATLGHDVGHQALTNRFLVANRDQLAITYNDQGVLENMHASFTYAIMQEESKNIFKTLDNESWLMARKVILKMILATDMSRHFELLGQFKAGHSTAQTASLNKLDERITLLEIAIKCADIGHAAKTLELHEKWTLLVCEEFFHQGDLEKALNQPVSMYCDRETTDIAKSQSGFIANIVLPLFITLNSFLDSVGIETNCIAQLQINKEHWDSKFVRKRRYTIKAKITSSEVKNEFESLKDKLRSWKRG